MSFSEAEVRRFLASLDVEGDDRRAPAVADRPTRGESFERGWRDRGVRRYSTAALARLTWRTLGHRARDAFPGVGPAAAFEVFRAVFDHEGPLPPRRGPRGRLGGRRPVLLLYTAADRDLAVRVHGALRARGVVAWCDAIDLLPGEAWDEGITDVLACAAVVLVLITARWPALGRHGAGHYPPEDVARAIDEAQRRMKPSLVVPVRFDGIGREHIPYGLYRTVPILASARDLAPVVDGVRRVLAEVGGEADATTPIQVAAEVEVVRLQLAEARLVVEGLEREGADRGLLAAARLRVEALAQVLRGAGGRADDATAPTEAAAGEVTGEVTERTADEVTERTVDEVTERTVDEVTDEVTAPEIRGVDSTDTLRDARPPPGSVVLGESAYRPVMVYIPPGALWVGSPEDEDGRRDNEAPRRRVRLSRGFLMASTPVTAAQFWSTCRGWREHGPGAELPITGVTWEMAIAYCNALSAIEGLPRVYVGGVRRAVGGYRLPTEAEWEHACRAGTVTRYWSGDAEADLDRVGWYRGNSQRALHPVGLRPASPWGLHDMHGNCREWCHDWYGPYAAGAVTDPTGPAQGHARVVRGGSSWSTARGARSAFRAAAQPHATSGSVGFRVVHDAP